MTRVEVLYCRHVIALIWLVTGVLSFGLYPVDNSLLLLQGLNVARDVALGILYVGALLDIVLGLLTLLLPRSWLWLAQFLVITCYTVLATVLVPEYWLHPFGPLLKNFSIMALLWLLCRHDKPEGRFA